MINHKEIENKWRSAVKTPHSVPGSTAAESVLCITPRLGSFEKGTGETNTLRCLLQADAKARFLRLCGKKVSLPVSFESLNPAVQRKQSQDKLPWETVIEQLRAQAAEHVAALGIAPDQALPVPSGSIDLITLHQQTALTFFKKKYIAKRKYPTDKQCSNCGQSFSWLPPGQKHCPACALPIQWKPAGPWLFRLNSRGEEILQSLKKIAWPSSLKKQQRILIGRQSGIQLTLKIGNPLLGQYEDVSVFVEHPEQLLAMEFLYLNPDHPALEFLPQAFYRDNIRTFQQQRTASAATAKKLAYTESVLTGIHVINPITLERLPVVLSAQIATGIEGKIGVPGYNTSDRKVAEKHKLRMRQPFGPPKSNGINVDATYKGTGHFEDKSLRSIRDEISDNLVQRKIAQRTVQHNLQSYVFSTEAGPGIPLPAVSCAACGETTLIKELPFIDQNSTVSLQDGTKVYCGKTAPSYRCPKCSKDAGERHSWLNWGTDFIDALLLFLKNQQEPAPFQIFLRERDRTYPLLRTLCITGFLGLKHAAVQRELIERATVIGGLTTEKSRPLFHYIEKWGTDAVRIAILAGSSHQKDLMLTEGTIYGAHKMLARIFALFQRKHSDKQEPGEKAGNAIQQFLHTITPACRTGRYHKTYAALSRLIRRLSKDDIPSDAIDRGTWCTIALCLFPFAPHHAAELYSRATGGAETIVTGTWPASPKSPPAQSDSDIAVFLDGKLCDRFPCAPGTSKKDLSTMALGRSKIQEKLHGQRVKLIFTVKDYLVNIVPQKQA